MKFGIDLSDPSTYRGGVWLLFCLGSLYAFLGLQNVAIGGALIAAAGTIAGGIGVFTKNAKDQ